MVNFITNYCFMMGSSQTPSTHSPAPGVIKVSEGDVLFPWLRVALGALAVVQELTLKAAAPRVGAGHKG